MSRDSVVLLHSSAASARQWDALAGLLAPRFEVHAIDLHGHGARAPHGQDTPLTLGDEAALAAPIVARAGRVHLVGHSYGGAVVCEIARRHPAAVASVTVFEPVLFGLLLGDDDSLAESAEVVALAAAIGAQVVRGELQAAAQRFVGFWSGTAAWAAMGESRQAAVAARMPAVALHFDAAFAAADPRPALARLPLLCLSGERTADATRRIAEILRSSLPHAEHARLQGLGHMGPLTHAAVVNARIADFLLRHSPESAASTRIAPQPQPESQPA
jgi:pimeloyl-ACP methyl ester carboxylesterase